MPSILALATIIRFDVENRRHIIINRGETAAVPADIPEAMALEEIEAGKAEWADDPAADLLSSAPGDIKELRARYTDVAGKPPFNGWDAAALTKKINALSGNSTANTGDGAAAAADTGGTDEADAPAA